MAERDYPVGHPAAADYKGEPYTPPRSPYTRDFDEGHPAFGGKNIAATDTPDGMRAAANKFQNNLQELAAIGSLPPLVDDNTGEALQISPEQLAYVYAVRKGLTPANQQIVTERYKLEPMNAAPAAQVELPMSAEQQALNYIISLNYTPERAQEILDKYGVPDAMSQKAADSNR